MPKERDEGDEERDGVKEAEVEEEEALEEIEDQECGRGLGGILVGFEGEISYDGGSGCRWWL